MNSDLRNFSEKKKSDQGSFEHPSDLTHDQGSLKHPSDFTHDQGSFEHPSDLNQCGYLEIRLGPMRSGKSSYVGLTLAKLADEGFRCLLITHLLDERDESMSVKSDGTFSRHGKTSFILSEDIARAKTDDLRTINVDDYNVIAVDEGQFFEKEIVDTIKTWVNEKHKIVFCSGLDGDIHRQPFGHLLQLIPEADKVTKQSADCLHCQRELKEKHLTHFYALNLKAPFSALIKKEILPKEKQKVSSNPQIRIGGSDTFTSVCRFHHQQCMRS
jgi:thymidine kinase